MMLPPSVRIFVALQPADLRRGFDGLSALTLEVLDRDPFSGHLFVFWNRRRNRVKILFWDRTGFCIWYKRLEQGTFEKVGHPSQGVSLEIDIVRLSLILEGIDLSQAKRRKRYKRKMPV